MKLNVIGKTTVYGKEVNHIEGGFGEGQKVILARDVAEIHGVEVGHINELINRNIKNYNKDMLVNLLDFSIAGSDLEKVVKDLKLKTNNSQKYVYLLSEQGYMLLVSSMANDNPKKWEIMSKFISEYFQMREQLKQEKKDSYSISDPIERAKRWIEEEQIRLDQQEKIKEQEVIIEQKNERITLLEDVVVNYVSKEDIVDKRSKIVNMVTKTAKSKNGKDIQAQYRKLYKVFEMKYHIDLESRLESTEVKAIKPKIKNKMDYIDKVMNKIPSLYEIACQLFIAPVRTLPTDEQFLFDIDC